MGFDHALRVTNTESNVQMFVRDLVHSATKQIISVYMKLGFVYTQFQDYPFPLNLDKIQSSAQNLSMI